jgi:hypothetical protein
MAFVQTAVAGKLIACLAQAGVPDLLAREPMRASRLARAAGLDEDALSRALRAAAMLGVFHRNADGTWENTELGAALGSDAAGSARDYVVYALHDGNWRAWQKLDQVLRSGKPAFAAANAGMAFWDYMNAHAEVGACFHRGMAAMASMTARALPTALGLERFSLVADIGGGSGIVLAELLAATPGLKGILYDRADAMNPARKHLATRGLSGRVVLKAGDLFESVPGDADAYVLKNVLHDHEEQKCDQLLASLHAGMPDHATLFVVEAVLPEAGPHPAAWRDLHMMVALGGRERTEGEWRELLERHGFAIERITPLPGPDAVIEVRKRVRRLRT